MKINWVFKGLLQSAISNLPQSEKINYFFQRRITKNFPSSKKYVLNKALEAVRHFNYFEKYNLHNKVSDLVFYEFGAGWDLNVPLAFYMLGIDHQLTVDLNPHLRFELFNNALKLLDENRKEIEEKAGRELRNFKKVRFNNLVEIKDGLGIEYLAPFDARNTKLADNSVDYISNTVVLQNIPSRDLLPILLESYRILKKGGIFSCLIDLVDHFRYSDPKHSRFNFLKYSDFIWNFFNSSLLYQNRLRYPQYIDIISQTDFEILETSINRPTPDEIEFIKKLRINKQFKIFSPEELGIKSFWIVLRRP